MYSALTSLETVRRSYNLSALSLLVSTLYRSSDRAYCIGSGGSSWHGIHSITAAASLDRFTGKDYHVLTSWGGVLWHLR